jgi:hypothetical protein
MTLAFPVIGSYLAWRVGDGSQVRVGVDAIMGCGRDIFLPDEIIQHLQVIGRCTLNLIDNPDDTSLVVSRLEKGSRSWSRRKFGPKVGSLFSKTQEGTYKIEQFPR